MIRPFTCLAAMLAAGSGLYLYSEKHRTTLLDGRIDAVVSDTRLVRAQTSMLEAEWALLNQPDRLQLLATRFLPALQPIAPTQFVQLADLGSHLPALGPPPAVAATPGLNTSVPTGSVATPDDSTVPLASATVTPKLLLSAATSAPHPAPDAKPGDNAVRRSAIRLASLSSAPIATRHRASSRHLAPAGDQTPAYTAVAAHWRAVSAYSRPAPVLATAWSRPVGAPAPSYAGSALGIGGGIAPPMATPVAR